MTEKKSDRWRRLSDVIPGYPRSVPQSPVEPKTVALRRQIGKPRQNVPDGPTRTVSTRTQVSQSLLASSHALYPAQPRLSVPSGFELSRTPEVYIQPTSAPAPIAVPKPVLLPNRPTKKDGDQGRRFPFTTPAAFGVSRRPSASTGGVDGNWRERRNDSQQPISTPACPTPEVPQDKPHSDSIFTSARSRRR
jgi:hypothetical protein